MEKGKEGNRTKAVMRRSIQLEHESQEETERRESGEKESMIIDEEAFLRRPAAH